MKLTAQTCVLRNSPAVRLKAVIGKSKKLGISRRYQKTWSFPTVSPNFTLAEIRPTVEAEAKRWEAKILAREKEKPEAVAQLKLKHKGTP